MINKILLFFILSCLVSSLSFAFPVLTGQELLDDCQAALDIHDNNAGRAQIESNYLQGAKSGMCQGFLRGVYQAGNQRVYCLSDNVLVNIATVVKYLKDNPQQLYKPASDLVFQAYGKYFYCGRR